MTLCDVHTLPPTTAAVSLGASKDPGGSLTSIGTRQPWFSGIWSLQGQLMLKLGKHRSTRTSRSTIARKQ